MRMVEWHIYIYIYIYIYVCVCVCVCVYVCKVCMERVERNMTGVTRKTKRSYE